MANSCSFTNIKHVQNLHGYSATLGLALDMAFSNDDLPAFGKPTRPTSAINFKSSTTATSSPFWPLNCVTAWPPMPPLATVTQSPLLFSSPKNSFTHSIVIKILKYGDWWWVYLVWCLIECILQYLLVRGWLCLWRCRRLVWTAGYFALQRLWWV